MRVTALLVSVPAMFFVASAQAAIVYDNPVKTEKVALKPDKANPNAKAELSCFSYNGFGIKQADHGEVGAELSLVKLAAGKTLHCSEKKQKGEKAIPGGYFAGVKDKYVFINAPDGVNGGQGFDVFNGLTQTKLLEDVAQGGIGEAVTLDNVFTLHYQRVHSADCSVITGGEACAASIAKATGVNASAALCTAGYTKGKEAMARGRCEAQSDKSEACFAKEMKIVEEQKWDSAPSVVVYNVQAVIGSTSSVVALGDALECRASD